MKKLLTVVLLVTSLNIAKAQESDSPTESPEEIKKHYKGLIESLDGSRASNVNYYIKLNPDYDKSDAGFGLFIKQKKQIEDNTFGELQNVQNIFCKKLKDLCWSEQDQKKELKIIELRKAYFDKENELFLSKTENQEKEKILSAYKIEQDKVLCQEFSFNCLKAESAINTPDIDPSKNYKPESCVWASDLPRRIVKGPGCNTEGTKICVGYVVCDAKVGEGKFIRMSTCGASNCGESKAVECTKQQGYSSSKPKDESKESVSEILKVILTTPDK